MKINIRNLTFIALFAAILAVLAPISIQMVPVSFSLSIIGVFLAGLFLDKYSATIAMIVYIMLGAFGLPVFAGYKGGVPILIGPTGGYIIAYIFMAFIIAFICEKSSYHPVAAVLGMMLALLICYIFGTIWLAAVSTKLTFITALPYAVYPFIPFDIIKIAVCTVVFLPLKSRIEKIKAKV